MNFEFLEGKKTYLIAVATLMYALGGWVAGYLDFNQVIPLVLGALGLSGLRHGIVTQADMFEESEGVPLSEIPVETQ